jgi:hypothetical protein
MTFLLVVDTSRIQMNSIDQVFDRMPNFVTAMVNNLPQPNYLIGRWRALNENMTLEFMQNDRFVIRVCL